MFIENKIEQFLEEVRELEKFFLEAQSKEILPLSFFSSSIDTLNRLRTGIREVEAAQLQAMHEHLEKIGNELYEISEPHEPDKPGEPDELRDLEFTEEKIVPTTNILADTIGRKINPDFGKSLSLNDRFMFQRDLFHGNAVEMDQAFAQLNTFQSLKRVLNFLSKKYAIPWDSDSGIALKELLSKRFD